jgi:Flp pilus assembly pilin Flp
MSILKSILARLYRDKRGATMVEYSILIAIITAATIATIALVGGKVSVAWVALNTAMP